MPEPRPPFPSQPRQEFLTIRISKLAFVNGLLAVIIVVAVVALGFRERIKSQAALISDPVASRQQVPAAVSPQPPPGEPRGARVEAVAARPAESGQSDPLPPAENQAPSEGPAGSSTPRQPEVIVALLQPRQAVYLEPPSTDSAPSQPEVKPDDSTQLVDQPNQPAPPAPANPQPTRPPAYISPTTLNGAGATYPYPLYAKWFDEYHKLNPRIQINYQSIGSGAGVSAFLRDMVDFGATDVPTFDEQLSRSRPPILHIPTVLGAIVPIYNIPGVGREVVFTPEMLAGIYLGKITSWSDATIANLNPAVNLPNLPIVAIHRSEGNAATFVFTDYLSKVSRDWQEKVGKGPSVNWPVGLGAKGDEGVTGLVRHTPGAIGYLDLLYAEQNHVPFGSVRNAAGSFVKASLHSVTEAGASVEELPPNSGVSITNAPGKGAYPIAGFDWFLVRKSSNDPVKDQDLAAFLDWTIDAGRPLAENLGYAPIPRKMAAQVKKMITQMR